ncbi:MAG: SCO family protein [Nocardioides sp.]
MRSALAATAATVLLLAGCAGDDEIATQDRLTAQSVEPPFTLTDTSLTDTEGEPFSLTADTGKPLTLVFFGYTHCPDICQLVMSSLSSAMTRLDEADRERVDVVFVTTDPSRDDPETLRSYLDRLDPGFIGLTGRLAEIVAVAKEVGVFVADGEELASGGFDLGAHGSQIIALNGDDVAPYYWRDDTSAEQFADDIHQILAEEGNA